MMQIQVMGARALRQTSAFALAAVVVIALSASAFAMPGSAYAAATLTPAGAAATVVSTQATGLASAKAATIDKAVAKNAKTIVKKAGATSGSAMAKLEKIFTYVATPETYGGAFTSGSYLFDFYYKAVGTANAQYYPATQPSNMKGYYKKYAVDAFKTKTAVCYHYAALFAVAAKQALGSSATVKIAVGGTNVNGEWNPHHAWCEVKIGKATYVYDPMNGYVYSKNIAKKKDSFGPFCGTKKTSGSVSKYYKKYQGASYCKVIL